MFKQLLAGSRVLAVVLILGLAASPNISAQDVGDAELDQLLKKVEEKAGAGTGTGAGASSGSADAKPATPADQGQPAKEGEGSSSKPAKEGLDSKDEAVDDLLKKLGETEDAPETKSAPGGGGAAAKMEKLPADLKAKLGQDIKDAANKPRQSDLTDGALDPNQKQTDEHLEEILGRRNKKKPSGQDPESGMLAELIKEMREVEKKLSQPDTGEETQNKQKEIIKKLETAMQQARQQGSRGQMRRNRQQGNQRQQQQQQGEDPAQDPNQGVGANKPNKPQPKSGLANAKDIWGHLPPDLRSEMNNITKETMLESRKNLIERYYLSVARKGQPASGGN